jgi:hypothetical protein
LLIAFLGSEARALRRRALTDVLDTDQCVDAPTGGIFLTITRHAEIEANMNRLPNHDERKSLLADLAGWLRRSAQKYAQQAEIDKLTGEDLARIAGDIGVSIPELRTLAGKPPDAADLLYHRMRVLHLDPDETGRAEPAVLRDLQRLCSMCESRGRCEWDLSEQSADSNWQDYCPNSMTLRGLVAARPVPDGLESLIERLNVVGFSPLSSDVDSEGGRKSWMH